ncbi:hypothetical protein BV898_05628 [Hypsibius exemplaris]|uniref:Tc1-like transposase DDE domain-containing protein n=1 Tax=Hypsibius exemplaris TaxID=2072580 RepID=A0A1W0WZ13_HYPEX|nr:hypothetical protein BV898_05628 [Hypsibius exemplaris]
MYRNRSSRKTSCNVCDPSQDCYITQNPHAIWEEIQVKLAIGSAALDIILHYELDFRKFWARWIPHMLLEGQPRPTIVRRRRSAQKSMLLIFFNYQGVFLRTNFARSPRHKAVTFEDDNASCRTFALTKTFLRKHKLATLPQPPYSPDLAPAD